MSRNVRRSRSSTKRTRNQRSTLLLRHGPFCGLCGRLIVRSQHSADHKLALVRGGRNSLDNLQLAHRRCNEEKSDRIT